MTLPSGGGGRPRALDPDHDVCRLARMALDVQSLMEGYQAPDGGPLVVGRCRLTPG